MTVKGKHLTLDERTYIEDALNENYSLKHIAKHLGKDSTTISKEVKRNRVDSGKACYTGQLSCKRRKNCQQKHICSPSCDQFCKKCKIQNCYRICPDYEAENCVRTSRFPHVCNGCTRNIGCKLPKYRYRAKVAQANYIEELKTSREGISLSPEEFDKLDALISPGILKGQPLTHIYAHHKESIRCSKRTLYAYFERNLFTARNIDLPRKVKYKKRKKRIQPSSKGSTHRNNKSYQDFQKFVEKYPETQVVEMDTVEGKKGDSKCLLTLFFRNSSLMLVFLLEECTQLAVKQVFDQLCENLGNDTFKATFPLILTDNGSEFKAPELLELDDEGNSRTRLFYCDPLASHQKGRIEKNHEYIRYILPKGKTFERLTKEKVALMMNHINSTARESLNDNTPFKLAQLLHNSALFSACDLSLIPPDEVHLKPALLKA